MKKVIYFFLLVSFAGCDNDQPDCSNIACTEIFKTIMVSIKDADENPVALDKFIVFDMNTGRDITREVSPAEYELMIQNGTYPLFGDEQLSNYINSKTTVNFKGFDDDKVIVNSVFTVGADCCHVLLYEGETEIIIN
ncbi:MAG: hypothetical protein ABFR32_05225 [Bacteroidota bacterium]